MTIALDYDDTYTADPELWDRFIADATTRGHRVFIVTARYPEEPIHPNVPIPHTRHVYTSRSAKKHYCEATLGLEVHIWIDDRPDKIISGW